jgi:hypothetical protein
MLNRRWSLAVRDAVAMGIGNTLGACFGSFVGACQLTMACPHADEATKGIIDPSISILARLLMHGLVCGTRSLIVHHQLLDKTHLASIVQVISSDWCATQSRAGHRSSHPVQCFATTDAQS